MAALAQTHFEQQIGISAIKSDAQQRQDVVALITPGATGAGGAGGGGMVTATRGQTLNLAL